jgi:hypothetical protein
MVERGGLAMISQAVVEMTSSLWARNDTTKRTSTSIGKVIERILHPPCSLVIDASLPQTLNDRFAAVISGTSMTGHGREAPVSRAMPRLHAPFGI